MRLGIARVDITPVENVPLLGYGDRTHASTGVHDPLSAYAWWLEPPSGPPLAWLILDLCLMSVDTARVLAEQLGAALGLPAGRVVVSTTHTHSGPDVRYLHREAAGWAVRYRALLQERLAAATNEARQSAFEGAIEALEGACHIGVNRRDSRLPVDPRIILLRLVDGAGTERGLIFHYSCHLTVLGADNYLVSADWAGPARRALERERGVPVAFLQGAEGNVDPVSRGVLEMGDPDQARGASFEVCEQLAGRMAARLRAALGRKPFQRLTSFRKADAVVPLPLRHGPLSAAQVGKRIQSWKQELGGFLGVPAEQVPEDSSINARVKVRSRQLGLGLEETRRWVAEQFAFYAFLNVYRRGGDLIDRERGQLDLPVSLLDFGGLLFLGAPVEILVEVAFDWQRRLAPRTALIAGLCGGWSGYLPHGSNFREQGAGRKYETVSTVFSPQAASRMLERAAQLATRSG
jgi:hypothetical protein